MQQCMYKTKIRDIDDLRKHLQTWFDFEQNIMDELQLTSGATV